jgi:hypothetical protein
VPEEPHRRSDLTLVGLETYFLSMCRCLKIEPASTEGKVQVKAYTKNPNDVSSYLVVTTTPPKSLIAIVYKTRSMQQIQLKHGIDP